MWPAAPRQVSIANLAVGGWSYHKLVLEEQRTVLIELEDEGSPSSDAYLVVGRPDVLPTMTPTSFQYTDWYSWCVTATSSDCRLHRH